MGKRVTKKDTSRDVAIIGMGCIFPQAPDLKTYWKNIVTKKSGITDPPADRLIDRVFDPESKSNDRIYCRRGGYIDDNTDFNPVDFGIMPVTVDGAEPEHFMALKVAQAALADAGFGKLPFNKEKFEVILGRGTFVNRGYITLLQHGLVVDQTLALLKQLQPDIGAETLAELKSSMKASLPPFSTETAGGLVSSVMTGIIANRMDLQGRTYTVDAACASALIALENAAKDLVDGHSDAALVGAVQVSTPSLIHMLFTQLSALTHHEALKPFDSKTDGTMLGEGIGMIVLKRLDDAIRDGHRIYAVVKAVGSSSDGKAKGMLAPRPEGEELAMRRAYSQAAVDPASVGLIEAHGTGLRLGDATEVGSLGSIFGNDGSRHNKIALGTVKSMIGHLIPAAGIAGLIKTSLALYHRTLPPTLGVDTPNPDLGIEKTPLYLNTETRPWIHGHADTPRRAGVNAFGFGGINAHAILEEHARDDSFEESLNREREYELVTIGAANRGELIAKCKSVLDYLQAAPQVELVDVAYTLWHEYQVNFAAGTDTPPARLGMVATDVADLSAKLATSVKQLQEEDRQRIRNRKGVFYIEAPLGKEGSLAFLFPGEGSQYVDMLKDLSLAFPEVRKSFDLLDKAFVDHERGFLPSEFIYPPPLANPADAEARMFNMDGAVDAVICADRALYRLVSSLGIKADVMVGHSSGEIMALEAAGAIEIADEGELIHFIREGNKAIEALAKADNIPEGQLLAVGGVGHETIEDVINASDGRLVLAMENCPHQFVLCGKPADIKEFLPLLAERGALCQPLPFSRAYHTRFYEPALGPLKSFFDTLPVVPTKTPLYSCLSAGLFPDDIAAMRELAVMQWARTVLFKDTIEKMYADGARIFLEVGPRSNLTGFVGDILKDQDVLVVACNSQRQSGLGQFLLALSQLFAHGVEMSLDPLFASRQPVLLDFSEHTTAPKRAAGFKLSLGLPIITLDDSKAREFSRQSAPRQARRVPDVPMLPQETLAAPVQRADHSPAPVIQAAMPMSVATPLSLPTSQAAGQPNNDGASIVFDEYIKTMDAFLEMQQQTMLGLMTGSTVQPPVAAGNEHFGALQGTVIAYEQGASLVSQHLLDLSNQTYLQHHTLGGPISTYDPTLIALPVVPLSMAVELMAEVAQELDDRLSPSRRQLGRIYNINLLDWMLLDEQHPLSLQTTAKVMADGAIAVQMNILADNRLTETANCVCVFRDTGPKFGTSKMLDIGEAQPASRKNATYYPDMLFHGEAFQSVQSVDLVASRGNQSRLQLPSGHWFQSMPGNTGARPFSAQPVLLDGVGQTVGIWLGLQFDQYHVAFPTGIDEIVFCGPPLQWQDCASVRVRTAKTDGSPVGPDDLSVTSDAVVLDRAGHDRLQVRGLRHRRIVMPNLFHEFRGSRQVRLTSPSDDLMPPLPSGGAFHCRLADLMQPQFWVAENGIWERVLAYIILSRRERTIWMNWSAAAERREWLLQLLVIKEAVVEFLHAHRGQAVWCADVEVDIQNDRIVVGGHWLAPGQEAPLVVSSKVVNNSGAVFDFAYVTSAESGQELGNALNTDIEVTQARNRATRLHVH
jgi:acyl transferase domain-containing protein